MVRSNTDDRTFADEYTETRREVTHDDVAYESFNGLYVRPDARPDYGDRCVIDFEYVTRRGSTKTVRCLQGTSTGDYDHKNLPEGHTVATFWHDGEKHAYDVDTGTLYKAGGDRYTTIAEAEDVTPHAVGLPDVAPVEGAISEGVSVRVWYRSTRSGSMKEMRLDDVRVDWEGDRVNGYHARRDRRVEVEACFERKATTKGKRETVIGRVARIEFPRGHRFDVAVEGLSDEGVDDVRDLIDDAVSKRLNDDFDVDVTHTGDYDW